jgi:hypothetical protein
MCQACAFRLRYLLSAAAGIHGRAMHREVAPCLEIVARGLGNISARL